MYRVTAATLTILLAFAGSAAHASDGYRDYQNRHGGGDDITDMLQNQRNAEAIANAYRQAHGLPKCSIGLIGQW
jgi:hypothetical protein